MAAFVIALANGQLIYLHVWMEKRGITTYDYVNFQRELVDMKVLLKAGANVSQRNERRDTPIDSVSGEWSDGLAGFYRSLNNSATHKVDLEQIQKLRPEIAKLLREHAAKQKR